MRRTRIRQAGALLGLALMASLALLGAGCGGDDDDGAKPSASNTAGGGRERIHEHADFALFIRGQQFLFDDPKFISVEDKELSDNVHIHDPRHTVIHVHREGTTWDEFWRSIGFELTDSTFGIDQTKTCMKLPSGEKLCNGGGETWKFVVNGVRVDGIALENIHGLERALFSFGSESDGQVMQQFAAVTDQACIPAGLCLARGNGLNEHGEPEEPCTKNDNACR